MLLPVHGERLVDCLLDFVLDFPLERHDDGQVGMPGDLPLGGFAEVVRLTERELLDDLLLELTVLDDELEGLHGLATESLPLTIVLRVGLPSR